MHPVWLSERIGAGQPLDRRPHRDRPGAHHECVVADQLLAAAGVADGQPVAGGIDAPSHGVEPELHPRRLEVGDGAVGEVLPAWHLAGDVVGDAADREVGIAVGDHNGHLYARVELRARRAALMPASLPPTATRCMGPPPLAWGARAGD